MGLLGIIVTLVIVWIFIMAFCEDENDTKSVSKENKDYIEISKINEGEKDSKDNTNKVFELVYKTDYFFEALEKDITTGEIRKKYLEEYLLVYNSTGKVSDKYSNYKLVYCKDITNGKRSSRVIDVYKDMLESSDIHYNEQITKCIIEDKIVPNNIKYYFENLYNCREIINLHNIDTRNIKDMSYMFSNCKNITELDLGDFNTENVTDMSCMFMCCENLELLNLRYFDTRKVKNFSGIFQLCPKLSDIYVGDKWIVNDDVNSEMFAFCKAKQVTNLGNKDANKQNNYNNAIIENKSEIKYNIEDWDKQYNSNGEPKYIKVDKGDRWRGYEPYRIGFDYDYDSYIINISQNRAVKDIDVPTIESDDIEGNSEDYLEEYESIVCQRCNGRLYTNENNGNTSLLGITCPHCGTVYANYCPECRKYEADIHCSRCGSETVLEIYDI